MIRDFLKKTGTGISLFEKAILALFALLLFVTLPGIAYPICGCGFEDGIFTIDQPMTIDGNMSDWAVILADPDNNACDGGDPADPLVDRDSPGPAGQDIIRFTYTWNTDGVYLYTERTGSSANIQNFVYYTDTDNDGYMETGEPVFVAVWKGSNRNVKLYLGTYVENVAGGDLMVDSDGYADGYTLPGTVSGLVKTGEGSWGSSDGLKMELLAPWADLGISYGDPFSFHVSSTNSKPGASSFPASIDDNIAGCGGGPGGTQTVSFTFTPDQEIDVTQNAVFYVAHAIINTGNYQDTYNLTSTATGSYTPGISYYLDADSSGTFTSGDILLVDTDGDGNPDTDSLGISATIDILISYTIAGTDTGITDVTTIAASSYQPLAKRSVIDKLMQYPDIVMLKSVLTYSDPVNGTINPKAIPGANMLYTIQATNQAGGMADTDTVFIIDPMPANTSFFAGDLGGAGSGPITFIDGTTSSGLTYTFISLGDTTDDVDFSNDNGATYNYIPVPDINGYDSSVSAIRINPKGVFNGAGSGNNPDFMVRFRVMVE